MARHLRTVFKMQERSKIKATWKKSRRNMKTSKEINKSLSVNILREDERQSSYKKERTLKKSIIQRIRKRLLDIKTKMASLKN